MTYSIRHSPTPMGNVIITKLDCSYDELLKQFLCKQQENGKKKAEREHLYSTI